MAILVGAADPRSLGAPGPWLIWHFGPEAGDLARRLARGDVGAAIRQEDPLYRWAAALQAVIPESAAYVFLDDYTAGKEIEIRYYLAPRRHLLLSPELPAGFLFYALHQEHAAFLLIRESPTPLGPGAQSRPPLPRLSPGKPPGPRDWPSGWMPAAWGGGFMIEAGVMVLRLLLGLGALFFLGYALLTLLTPRPRDFTGLERAAFSFGIGALALTLWMLALTWWGTLFSLGRILGPPLALAAALLLAPRGRTTVREDWRSLRVRPRIALDGWDWLFLGLLLLVFLYALPRAALLPHVGLGCHCHLGLQGRDFL